MTMRMASVIVGLVVLVPTSTAQVNTGSIQGVVADASGAVVPGATLSVKNLATGVTLTVTTNEVGFYLASGLLPGHYEIEVKAAGFKPARLPSLLLQVGDQLRQNFTLEVGAVTESIEVRAEAPLLQAVNASLGAVVDTRKILDMPMLTRDVRNLARLAPGVSPGGRIGGAARAGVYGFYVDGVPADSARANIPVGRPSVEAVAELKVETNNLSAEYGRLTGGALNIVTRGGTNQIHGSLYEFHWNHKMNANSWANNFRGFSKSGFKRNMFGGSISGPVVLPGYDGRNRTFFFFGFDGNRENRDAVMRTATVPTEMERQGDFSESLRLGQPVRIFDPFAYNAATDRRAPFPGQKIPASRFSPLAQALVRLYPLPNRPPDPGTQANNYQGPSRRKGYGNDFTVRADQTVSDNHRLFFRFTQNDFGTLQNPWMGPATAEHDQFQDNFNNTLSYTANLGPTLILTANGGLAREWIRYGRSARDAGFDLASLPLAPNYKSLLDDRFMPVVTLQDKSGIYQTWRAADIKSWKWYASAAITKIAGIQTIKAGYVYTKYFGNFSDNEAPAGVWNFTSTWTQERPTAGVGQDGFGLASMLLGTPASYSFTQIVRTANAWTNHAAYVQDDIRITSRLTLNLGIRWDFEAPATERYNRLWFWDDDIATGWRTNPSYDWKSQVVDRGLLPADAPVPKLGQPYSGYVGFPLTPAYPGRGSSYAYWKNFSPRLGAAWQVTAKTVIRGGWGRFYNGFTGRASGAGSAGLHPFVTARGSMVTTVDGGRTVAATIDNPFPNDNGLRPSMNDPEQIIRAIAGQALGSIYHWRKKPAYDDSFNFSVQRELPASAVIEVSYAGNRGHRLNTTTARVLNYLPVEYLPLGALLRRTIPNPFVGSNLPVSPWTPSDALQRAPTIEYQRLLATLPHAVTINMNHYNVADSWYNAMFVRLEKRLTHGLSLMGAYTLSKLVTDIAGQPQDGRTVRDVRALSEDDVPHRLVLAFLYELPAGKGRRWLSDASGAHGKLLQGLLGGWRVAGIYDYVSGRPLQITQSSQTTGLGLNQRPSVAGSYRRVDDVRKAVGLPGQTAALYVNREAFVVTPPYTLGTAPFRMPNLRGPSRQPWDLSLMKTFPLGERARLQLRVEAQNAFNQVFFADPDTNIQSAAFGTIASTQTDPRLLQIGARIDW